MKTADLTTMAQRELEQQGAFRCRLLCCASTACLSSGSAETLEALRYAVHAHHLDTEVQVASTGCIGLCSHGPMVRMQMRAQPDTLYQYVTAEVARRIVDEHIIEAGTLSDMPVPHDIPHFRASIIKARARRDLQSHVLPQDVSFFSRQLRVVLAQVGLIDPERLEDYVAHGGYATLDRVVHTMTPEQVCDEIQRSGLRGRGGAGYPTGLKWHQVRAAPGARKFVIANGDEGDPGAYMDSTLMEADPHRIVEGMAIAGYALGAQHGYIYVRGENPLAVRRLEKAIQSATNHGILGERVLGSKVGFMVEIRIGAGAYVCGEETALIASVEGKRGMPRMRPPYPSVSGLWGCPTLINNVETFGNIVPIMRNGAEWFAGIGSAKSKGTKVFALTGKLRHTGLIEVPMGITLREIIYEIGDGIPNGRKFKAAQTGGPSGGWVPADHLDTPVDYESLQALGSIMGSGGLIVIDDKVSMPEVAQYFMEFCMDESCGKCVSCRVGTVKLHRLLQAITSGNATQADLQRLEELCALVQKTSLCGLGRAAPNPILSTLRYFRSEYEALVHD